MKKIFTTLLCLTALQYLSAQPPKGDAAKGDFYGQKPALTATQPINLIPNLLANKDSFATKVIAEVTDVCPKKGCWIKLKVNDTTSAFVKMKDYGFFVPTAIVGKKILLEGDVKLITTSVAELKHYAEDAKKSKAEIDAITSPKKEIRFLAKGIMVVD